MRPLAAASNASTPSIVDRSASTAVDFGAELLEVGGGGLDQRFVGDDEDVVAVLGRERGEFEADARRGTGDDREFIGHCSSNPLRVVAGLQHDLGHFVLVVVEHLYPLGASSRSIGARSGRSYRSSLP